VNIAIFASAFHPHFGGVEELCRQLAHEYRRLGLGVIVVTNRWPRNLPAFEEFEGIPVYRIAMRVPDGNFRVKLNYHLTAPGVRREMFGILRARRIDTLHVQCVSANGLYALDGARKLRLPLTVTLQGELTMDAGRLFERSIFARGMMRRVLDGADMITGCSRKTLEDGEAFQGHPFGARGAVVFNGARIEDFRDAVPFSHPRPYILAIGRVVPQKGFDLLLRAFAAAGPGVEGHDLIIAGDGVQLPELKALVAELGLQSRVRFPGKADRATAVGLFCGCSFFALPSRADEGLPVVCAEALAAGKAVVATRSGGAPEAIVHGRTGLIVEREDVAGLAAALTTLTRDANLRGQFAAAARERSALFGWRAIAAEYLNIYERARASFAGRRSAAAVDKTAPAAPGISPT
jgi:glycosyltransferase involved in cell wall biosynthesis